MLIINTLAAATEVLIPAQAQYLSIKGLEQLIRTISKVRRQINPTLSTGGKLRIFESVIPLSVRAAETSAEGKSIYLHDPTGKVASAYAALTKLLPELLVMVDDGTFSVITAADYIADLPQDAQGWLLAAMKRLDCTPTVSQLARIKKYQQEDIIFSLLENWRNQKTSE